MRSVLKGWTLWGLMSIFNVSVATTTDPMTHFFESNWGDYSEELPRAKEENKQAIMLFFVMDDCPFCDRMKKTILNQTEVQTKFKEDFLGFQVDVEGDVTIVDFTGQQMKEKDFAQKVHRVRATPVTVFFDTQGEQIFRFTGPVSGVEEFLQMLDYIKSGAYKDMRFNRFKTQSKAS